MVERLVRVVSAEYIPVWLNKPVPALGSHKPLDVLAAGEYRRVATLISELEARRSADQPGPWPSGACIRRLAALSLTYLTQLG